MDECAKNIENGSYADCLNKTPKERAWDIANILGGTVVSISVTNEYAKVCVRDVPRKDGGYYPPLSFALRGCEITDSSAWTGALEQYKEELEHHGYIIKTEKE